MKKTYVWLPRLLLLSGVLWGLSLNGEELSTDKKAQREAEKAVQQEVLTFLRPDSLMRFSRRRLAPPHVEWREELAPGIRSFLVKYGDRQVLLGMYAVEEKAVYVMVMESVKEVSSMKWVKPEDHPVIRQVRGL